MTPKTVEHKYDHLQNLNIRVGVLRHGCVCEMINLLIALTISGWLDSETCSHNSLLSIGPSSSAYLISAGGRTLPHSPTQMQWGPSKARTPTWSAPARWGSWPARRSRAQTSVGRAMSPIHQTLKTFQVLRIQRLQTEMFYRRWAGVQLLHEPAQVRVRWGVQPRGWRRWRYEGGPPQDGRAAGAPAGTRTEVSPVQVKDINFTYLMEI